MTHSEECQTITHALTAARLYLDGTTPPDDRWRLTPELIDEAHRAVSKIEQCRRRILFR